LFFERFNAARQVGDSFLVRRHRRKLNKKHDQKKHGKAGRAYSDRFFDFFVLHGFSFIPIRSAMISLTVR